MTDKYDHEYPTCERTDIELRVYPGGAPPEWVTEKLGIEPTSQQRVGDKHTNSIGRTRVARKNAWFLSSAGKVESRDARRHIDWLLERLSPVSDRLRDLQAELGVTVYLTCVWWSAHGHGGPTLSPRQLRALADLELELQFDLYFFDEDDA